MDVHPEEQALRRSADRGGRRLTVGRGLWLAALSAGIALGLAVEWAFFDPSLGLPLAVADFGVGCVLIVCGVLARVRRADTRTGQVMALAGFTWFLGNVSAALLYFHRGPLVQLYLTYPSGRVRSRLVLGVVVAAYVDATIAPLARNDALTLALAAAVALTAVHLFRDSRGSQPRYGWPALSAALAFACVLASGALGRLVGRDADAAVLWTYDAVIASTMVGLLVDLLRYGSTEDVVTGLVVDLGRQDEGGTLETKLSRALGDPSLVIGYRVRGRDGFVGEDGSTVEMPPPSSGRAITPLVSDGEELAVLVHDASLLDDSGLVESVAAATRLAVTNAGLQAEARAKAVELEASRRRILAAADSQRRRIQEQLDVGARRRLDRVASLLASAHARVAPADIDAVAKLIGELGDARRALDEFAAGVHPPVLTDQGLMAALAQLGQRSVIPVDLHGTAERLPGTVEAALFFVCSEALVNVGKHAAASRAVIEIGVENGWVHASVWDDGIGGADPSIGSGLRGLADRVEALGGRLRVTSPARGGTLIEAEVPLSERV